MYTLFLPVDLPSEHGFCGGNAPAEIAPGLHICCRDPDDAAFPDAFANCLDLKVSGFASAEEAGAMLPRLRAAVRCASLDLGHGFRPSMADAGVPTFNIFDGGTPHIYPTALNPGVSRATAHVRADEHISKLARSLSVFLADGAVERMAAEPELAAAVRLYSEADFAGGYAARMVVLMSAIEVLVPRQSTGKRNHIIRLVKAAATSTPGTDAKAVGRELDRLYEVRNALLHEGADVQVGDVTELDRIVRLTLRARLAGLEPRTRPAASS